MSRVEAPPSGAILGNRAEDAQFEDWYNTVFSELSTSDAAARQRRPKRRKVGVCGTVACDRQTTNDPTVKDNILQ